MCASVESTLAGVDIDAVSGPVVIHLLMCVLMLNQYWLVLILTAVEDQAALSDGHQLASCILD